MEKSSQIAWKLVPLRHLFPLKVVPLIEVLLYLIVERFLSGQPQHYASRANSRSLQVDKLDDPMSAGSGKPRIALCERYLVQQTMLNYRVLIIEDISITVEFR
jgi:hypothetical protein